MPAWYQGNRTGRVPPHGVIETLEETEENAAATGRKIFEASGITVDDLDFENLYDGFSLFHAFHIEGIGYAGIKRGEALDLFQTDISIHGPNPVSPSGGNIGERPHTLLEVDRLDPADPGPGRCSPDQPSRRTSGSPVGSCPEVEQLRRLERDTAADRFASVQLQTRTSPRCSTEPPRSCSYPRRAEDDERREWWSSMLSSVDDGDRIRKSQCP